MFKAARWRGEKKKIKAVYKFQFKATQVPQLGWQTMMVSLVPVDVGKPTTRSDKAAVVDGACHWANTVSETVKLTQDSKSGKINEKLYQFIVSATGSTKAGLLGETTINLADYAESFKASSISLQLRPSTTGAILHVTLQRMLGDVEGREADENGDTIERQRKTLKSQLSNSEDEEGSRNSSGTNNFTEGDTLINSQAQLRFPSSRTLLLHADSNGDLRNSSSSDTISALGSESSSERYTPKENGIKNANSDQHSASLLSSLSNDDNPLNPITNLANLVTEYRDHQGWSMSSAPDGSMAGSTNSLGDNGWRERLLDPDVTLEKLRADAVALARQVEISELELQTLRKQVVKESRRAPDLLRELSSLKEERDALQRECEELKTSQKRSSNDGSVKPKYDGEDPWFMLEEIRQALNHEKNLNSNLCLQLQKTQEANSELILAVKDLDELLEQKNKESSNCATIGVKMEINREAKDNVDPFVCVQTSECKEESFETISEHYDELYELEELVKEQDDVRVSYSVEQQIIDLKNEVELYRKDREDLEMQMEQLALDYEILKQENHDISSKLEQTQLREQLRIQYECSAHLAVISELEAHVECLEKELVKQAEAFEEDLETVTHDKIEQEKRAIKAEEALRMTQRKNASTAKHLQEEFKRLSAQMPSQFYSNEKLAMQAIMEASELRFEKCNLEELLEKTNEDLASAQVQFRVNLQELLSLIDMKAKEIDKLTFELKNKCEELENRNKFEETKQKASLEELLILKAEIEKLSREKIDFSEQLTQKENLLAEMEILKTRTKEVEKLLQDRNVEKNMLEREFASLKEDANKLKEELNDMQHSNDEKVETIRILSSDLEALKTRFSEHMHSLFEDEMAEKKLRQIIQLRGDLQKEDDTVNFIEKQTKDSNLRPTAADGTTKLTARNKNAFSIAPNCTEEVASLHEKFNFLEDNLLSKQNGNVPEVERHTETNFDRLSIAYLQEVNNSTVNVKIATSTDVTNGKENSSLAWHGDEACMYVHNDSDREAKISTIREPPENDEENLVFCTSRQSNIAEVLSEMTMLKERNESMEAELKEMQQRYSEISLKFAEVEGERQQLVMTIRALKNAMK